LSYLGLAVREIAPPLIARGTTNLPGTILGPIQTRRGRRTHYNLLNVIDFVQSRGGSGREMAFGGSIAPSRRTLHRLPHPI